MKISNEFKIGVMAIVVISLTFWGYKFLRGRNVLKHSNDYYVRYADIEQLAVSSPVLIHGFSVGTVSAINLDKDMKTVIATLNLDRDVKIPADAVAMIMSTSIMGGKAIDLRVSGPCSGDGCAKPGSFLEGRVKGIFDSLLDKGENGTLAKVKENIGDILNTLGDSLTSPNSNSEIAKTYTQLSALITNLSSITGTLDKSMGSYDRHLNNTLANVEAITGAIAKNQDKIASSISHLESITKQFDESKAGANAGALITDAQNTVKNLNATIAEANKSFTQLSTVMKDMQNGKGSLGKLLKDEGLYTHTLATTKNLELLLQDFRLNPKRYVNVSVFGKKQKAYELPENDPAMLNDTMH
ncbi:MAG: MCE family protein [Saprospiraceae bacterium]|uniref:MCE family protein n=1 Tax=Candidatus Opimibacter skivensis TaxID=2982028 RepID=A0A9D7STI8_9BACT|nr:MCE family protein [Candidatus Opimibacter skivensis]